MGGLGKVRIINIGEDDIKRSVKGHGEDMGQYVKATLTPSKRRTKFNTVLIPWSRICKVVVY